MSKKKVFLIVSFLLSVVSGSVGFYYLNLRDEKTIVFDTHNSENPPRIILIEDTKYFVPVVKFKTYKETISLQELSQYSVVVLKDYGAVVNEFFPDSTIDSKYESVEEIYNKLNSSDDKIISFLPVNQVDPRFKILKFDGLDIFDKSSDISNYKLVSKTEREINYDELENELKLKVDSKNKIITSNYNRDSLTTFFAGGEIITGRGVDIMWLKRSNNNFTFLFDRIKNDMINADLSVALLEHSYLGNPEPCSTCTAFLGDEALIPQLKEVGIDILSLAGNHIGDVAGEKGQIRTQELLDQNGIKYFGAGANINEASKAEIVEVNGKKYSFLAAEEIAYFFWAGEDSRGSNTYSTRSSSGQNVINYEKIKTDIAAAKGQSDYIVVYMSWGVEYTNYATDSQVELAHAIIDAGADLIISSHPHWIQNMEIYKDKLIIYSLGNFIFDQTHNDDTRKSIYVNLNFYDNKLINVEVVPFLTCGYHFGAKNLAYDVISGVKTYSEVDNTSEAVGCVWLQPKPLDENHPRYRDVLDKLFEYTKF